MIFQFLYSGAQSVNFSTAGKCSRMPSADITNSTFSLSLENSEFLSRTVIYFEHEDLDNWVKQLKAKGIHFDQEPTDERYLWREAVLHDPSGNKIKLYWAGENRLNPPWRVEIRT